jgi:hypothetical protein
MPNSSLLTACGPGAASLKVPCRAGGNGEQGERRQEMKQMTIISQAAL